ncbi:MAG: zinc ribbon domain-containing protein, partial [Phycisphaerae bacterium]|nr:zinc ribbon domain-containing protein [Phycisphaerae bacterium]
MFPLKRMLLLCFLLLLTFGVLMAAWPLLSNAYTAVFHAGGNLVFGSFGSEGQVRFERMPADKPSSRTDTQMVLRNRTTRFESVHNTSVRYLGYVPTIVIITLVLNTPIPWRRRWLALLLGFLLVQGFVAIRIVLLLLHHFSADNEVAQYSFNLFWKGVLTQTCGALVGAPPSAYVVPILIWIAVAFRRGDLVQWMNSTSKLAPAEAFGTEEPPCICYHCRHENEPGATFCARCG